jgi:hypothetical protein
MTRIPAYLLLLLSLVFSQALSLHCHLPGTDGHKDVQIHQIQAHSHALDGDMLDHESLIPIDLLVSAVTMDQSAVGLELFLAALWVVFATILWVCIRRCAPRFEFVYFGPPHTRRPSPRAPPFASHC